MESIDAMCREVIATLVTTARDVATVLPASVDEREEPDDLDEAGQLVAYIGTAMRTAWETQQLMDAMQVWGKPWSSPDGEEQQ